MNSFIQMLSLIFLIPDIPDISLAKNKRKSGTKSRPTVAVLSTRRNLSVYIS